MSVQRQSFYECSHPDCDNDHSRTASYCSEDCRLKHKGRKLLRNVKHDHRFCSTCFKPLKIVYRPEDSKTPKLRKKALIIRESFVGFQDFTEHVEHGDYGIECSCGNVDHYHSEPDFRDSEGYEWWLRLVIETFNKEGQLDADFDLETFADTFWQTDDFELAVGKALE